MQPTHVSHTPSSGGSKADTTIECKVDAQVRRLKAIDSHVGGMVRGMVQELCHHAGHYLQYPIRYRDYLDRYRQTQCILLKEPRVLIQLFYHRSEG
jgi:hypothetical protein